MIPRQDIQFKLEQAIESFERRVNDFKTIVKFTIRVFNVRTLFCCANIRIVDEMTGKEILNQNEVRYSYEELGVSLF